MQRAMVTELLNTLKYSNILLESSTLTPTDFGISMSLTERVKQAHHEPGVLLVPIPHHISRQMISNMSIESCAYQS